MSWSCDIPPVVSVRALGCASGGQCRGFDGMPPVVVVSMACLRWSVSWSCGVCVTLSLVRRQVDDIGHVYAIGHVYDIRKRFAMYVQGG